MPEKLEKLGKYQLEHLIAVGGMAEVYKASMVGPSGFVKPVCVKKIRSEFSKNADFVEMFENEARIAATLQHPNIIGVFDFDSYEENYFLVMEYVDGIDLKEIIEHASSMEMRLPVPFVIFVANSLFAALSHAHERKIDGEIRQIIHRDISPHNILVATDGIVKLADFGIAKAKGYSSETSTGIIKGKLAYLSPEQAMGKGVCQGTDLFASGLVIWEMLSGQRLFKGEDTRETVAQILGADIPTLSYVHEKLNAYVKKLLSLYPEDRFANARQASKELLNIGIAPCEEFEAGELVQSIVGYRDCKTGYEELKEKQKYISNETVDINKTELSHPGNNPDSFPWKKATYYLIAALFVAVLLAVNFFQREKPVAVPVALAGIPPEISEQHVDTDINKNIKPEIKSPVIHLKALPVDTDKQLPEMVLPVEKPHRFPKKQKVLEGTGIININARPWANVTIGGVPMGTTPVRNLKLKTGKHKITLTNDRFDYKKNFIVKIRKNQTTNFFKSVEK